MFFGNNETVSLIEAGLAAK